MNSFSKIMSIGAFLAAGMASAEAVLQCKSEVNPQADFQLTIDLSEETSIDYLTYVLKEKGTETIYFNQHEKGSISKSIEGGVLVSNFFSEKSQQDNGRITDAGVVILTATGQPKKMSGLFAAKDGIYPLDCDLTGVLALRFPNPPSSVNPPQGVQPGMNPGIRLHFPRK
jgi:hypothetical protein